MSGLALELGNSKRPAAVREFLASPPPWLEVRPVTSGPRILRLHAGESEAIALSLELRAELLLVDDRKAYAAAKDLRIPAVGIIGLLERAARERLVDLEEAFARLKKQTSGSIRSSSKQGLPSIERDKAPMGTVGTNLVSTKRDRRRARR